MALAMRPTLWIKLSFIVRSCIERAQTHRCTKYKKKGDEMIQVKKHAPLSRMNKMHCRPVQQIELYTKPSKRK